MRPIVRLEVALVDGSLYTFTADVLETGKLKALHDQLLSAEVGFLTLPVVLESDPDEPWQQPTDEPADEVTINTFHIVSVTVERG